MLTVSKFFIIVYFVFVHGMGFVGFFVYLVGVLFGVFMAVVYLGQMLTGDS